MIKIIIKLLNKYKTIVKFGIAGVIATATHFALLFILTDIFGLWYLLSTSLAFLVAFMVSFFSQKFWTFGDKRKQGMYKQMGGYFLVVSSGMAVNAVGMYALVDYANLYYLIAQVIMSGLVAIYNFLMYRFVIFKRVRAEELARKNREGIYNTKKILIATPIFPPRIGGPATYSKILAEELSERGWEVVVVSYGVKNDKVQNPNVNSNQKSKFQIFTIDQNQMIIKKYWRFFRAVFRLAPEMDVIYCQDAVNAGLPVCLACYLRAKSFILKITGDYAWEHARECHGVSCGIDDFQNKKYNFKIEFMRYIRNRVARRAKKIITPSKYLKSMIVGWGINEDKIQVIYNAVPQAGVSGDKNKLRESLGLKGTVILSVGRLLPWKGFNELIDLMPALKKEIPDINLVIIGDGPFRSNVESQISNSECKNKIQLIPGVEQSKLWQYMEASDLFVLYTGYEGLPHLVIEAMMIGLPIITTRVGGNIEVVKNKDNGTLVDYGNMDELKNAIIKLTNNKEFSKRLAENAKLGLSKFSKEKMIEEVLKFLI
ncbi:glycosyltransferase [Candidatus Parcubacteria bacterium]|nr:glycosyltransferase [Candidatus Parcubacteria bacterium]